MSWAMKGDLVELQGKRYIALGDDYVKLVRESVWDNGVEIASAVRALKVVPADRGGQPFEIIYSQHGVPSIVERSAK